MIEKIKAGITIAQSKDNTPSPFIRLARMNHVPPIPKSIKISALFTNDKWYCRKSMSHSKTLSSGQMITVAISKITEMT
jgi:hypothetical protein